MDNSWLFDRFQECGDQPAIVWQDQSYSYRHLLDDVSKWQQVLAECRIDSGQCVALSGDFSFNTITLLLALIANRNIVVPLTSAVGTDRERYLDVACTGSVFEFDTNGAWGYYQNHASGDHPLLHSLRERREPGLIIFTSGSTGQFKAAVHNFSTLLSKFKKRGRAFRTLTFLRLDHMGGLNTLGYILSNRGTLVSLSSRTVDAVCQAIERHQVQLLPATPTFLNMLLISEGYKTYDLSSLETISYGTEPMHPATLDVLARTFPRVKLKQLYGLTELGILSTQSAPSDSLWVKVGGDGCEIKVVDGLLWVRAETAMLGYLNAPSPFDEDGWFNTGDVVEQRKGYLRILGRKSELINVGGEKVFPAEVENVILQMTNVKDVSVTGKANPLMGQVVVARVELCQPEDHQALEQRVRQFCKQHLAPFKVPVAVELAFTKLYGERFKKIKHQAEDL